MLAPDAAPVSYTHLDVYKRQDVHIIAEPGAERHVPAPPEFRHAGGDVWVVEVFLELETYHPPEDVYKRQG